MRRLALGATLLLCTSCLYQNPETTPGLETPSEEAGPDLVAPALAIIGKLAGPESVLHDPEQDVYFISNLNGGLLTRDNNGFISRVNAQTMEVELKWVAGGTNGVRLDAPKGMAIVGDTLFVSDVTGVRKFDRRTGAPKGEIALPGATLINDLTTDGRDVYASDTAVVPSAGITFAPTGTDAIWKISGDRATKIASGTQLNQPNGVDFFKGRLWVVTFRGGELYRLDGEKKTGVIKTRRPQLDGLVHLADGTPVYSSWTGNAVYRGNVPILRGVSAPADIGYDTKRRRLLVPNSPLNQVTIHPVG